MEGSNLSAESTTQASYLPPLPPSFDPSVYRQQLRELASLDDDELVAHYNSEGKRLGIQTSCLGNRYEFAALVPTDVSTLEIGPFGSPLLAGPYVRYADVLDTEQLRARAPHHGVDPAAIPHIHHVMHSCSLDDIDERFYAILSSHAIEHQPDLVAHLQQVERRLHSGGRYFILAPDKRYCFDRNLSTSTISEVLQAHWDRRTAHTLRSVIEHRVFMTHNDPMRHWLDERQIEEDARHIDLSKLSAAIREFDQAAGQYIDVHAWYFTPDSFCNLIDLLHALGLTQLKIERLYRTMRGRVEFWAVLSKTPTPGGPYDEAVSGPEELARSPELTPANQRLTASPRASLLARTLREIIRRS